MAEEEDEAVRVALAVTAVRPEAEDAARRLVTTTADIDFVGRGEWRGGESY